MSKRKPLEWEASDDVDYVAMNTAGLTFGADGAPCCFAFEDCGGGVRNLSHADLRLPDSPDEFDSVDAAKAWCEKRNAEL